MPSVRLEGVADMPTPGYNSFPSPAEQPLREIMISTGIAGTARSSAIKMHLRQPRQEGFRRPISRFKRRVEARLRSH